MADEPNLNERAVEAIENGDADVASFRLAVLTRFHKVYVDLRELEDMVAAQLKKRKGDPLDAKLTSFVALAARWKPLIVQLDELHHLIGHALFDACWADVDVLDEFKPRADPLAGVGAFLKAILPGVEVEEFKGDSFEQLIEKLKGDIIKSSGGEKGSGPELMN